MTKNKDLIIEDIINYEQVVALFQPLIFIKKKQIIGFEGLSRGLDPDTGELLSPVELISAAEKYGLVLQIDRLFRKKCLENFYSYYSRNKEALISINLNSNAIRTGFGSKFFLKSVIGSGIDPSRVIIEIMESEFSETDILLDFVMTYRENGFMIAMDDFGTGFSNWDRITLLKPDLIKLDRSIVDGIESDFFKQEVSKSLINLAHRTGSLVIAEGVETEGEAIKMMELNADILQGYYFSVPGKIDELEIDEVSEKIDRLSTIFRDVKKKQSAEEAAKLKQYRSLLDRIVDDILSSGMYLPDDAIKNAVDKYNDVECIYILDGSGVQISDTVMNRKRNKPSRSRIFIPDSINSDQSNKDYYYNLLNGVEHFISRPYISAATGNMCVTASRKYITQEGDDRVLCVDILGQ